MEFYVPFDEGVFNQWCNAQGDTTLRLDYDLNRNSIVLDVGGYKGEWAYQIHNKYGCMIHIIEPITHLYDQIVSNYGSNSHMQIWNIALADKTCELNMSVNGDSSSMFDGGGTHEVIKCVDVSSFFTYNEIDTIDLMKINIEGAEYDLLDRMIECDLISKVKNIQIQYHRFIPNCKERRDLINGHLSRTHKCQWNYDWIWESWQLKK